jgi:hypothetical protein
MARMEHTDDRPYRLDRTAIQRVRAGETPDPKADARYWLTKTSLERLAAAEYLREMMFGAIPRLSRVPTGAERQRR